MCSVLSIEEKLSTQVEDIRRQLCRRPLAIIVWQPATPPRPGAQGVETHQPLDGMQTADESGGQQVAPDASCAVGPVAVEEAMADRKNCCVPLRPITRRVPARSPGASPRTRTSSLALAKQWVLAS